MSRRYEHAREAGLISTYSVDEALGIAVNQHMFTRRVTRKALGKAVGLSESTMSRKIHGDVPWTVDELFAVAKYLGVEAGDLLPRRNEKIPASPEADGELVAGTGFEPVTSGL